MNCLIVTYLYYVTFYGIIWQKASLAILELMPSVKHTLVKNNVNKCFQQSRVIAIRTLYMKVCITYITYFPP